MIRIFVIFIAINLSIQNTKAQDMPLLQQCLKYKQAVEELNRNPTAPKNGQNIISSNIDCDERVFNFNWHLERDRIATDIEEQEFAFHVTKSLCQDRLGWRQALADGWIITIQKVTQEGNKSLINTIRSCP